MSKRCGKCGEEKDTSCFHKQSAAYCGLQNYCKECQRQDLIDRYDPEKESVRRKAEYAADPEKFRAKKRAENAASPGKNYAQVRAWRERFPDKCLAQSQSRRARKAAAIIEPIRANFLALALVAWDHRCAYCRCDLRSSGVRTEWDHFRPIARGGAEAEYNYVPACARCNGSKHARDPFSFLFDIEYVTDVSRIFETIYAVNPVKFDEASL